MAKKLNVPGIPYTEPSGAPFVFSEPLTSLPIAPAPGTNYTDFTGPRLTDISLPLWKSYAATAIPNELANQEISKFNDYLISMGSTGAIFSKVGMTESVSAALAPLTFTSSLVQAIKEALVPLYSYISIRWRTIFRNEEWNNTYIPSDICPSNDLRTITPKFFLPYGEENLNLFAFSAEEEFTSEFISGGPGATGSEDFPSMNYSVTGNIAPTGMYAFEPRRFNITVASTSATFAPFAAGVNEHAKAQTAAWKALGERVSPLVQEKILFQLFREPEHKPPVEGVHDVLLYKMKLCRVLNQFNIVDQFRHLFPDPELNSCVVSDLSINGPNVFAYDPPLSLFASFASSGTITYYGTPLTASSDTLEVGGQVYEVIVTLRTNKPADIYYVPYDGINWPPSSDPGIEGFTLYEGPFDGMPIAGFRAMAISGNEVAYFNQILITSEAPPL